MSETSVFRDWTNAVATRSRSRTGSALYQRLSGTGVAAMIGLGLLLYWVYGDRPLVGEAWQWADDGLYLRQAEALVRWLHGEGMQWLGPYDSVILAKAPLFAIWLAVLYVLHLPLRAAEFALLLLVPWLFLAAIRPMTSLSWWQLAIAGILLSALPSLPYEQRLLRNGLQFALTSGCEVAMVGLILRARHRDERMAPWAALTGLLFALAYLNREEAVWLVPLLACGPAAILVGCWWNRTWRRGLLATGCLVGAVVIPIALISTLNYHFYGIFVTTTRRAPAFTRAHQLLTALEPETRERYVPIRTATRLKAYTVSPTFARLGPHLEGPATDSIARNPGHLSSNGWSLTAREFFVSNFQFPLQEAAFQAGARSAPESEALFSAIARELESAIALGWIRAGGKGLATLGAPLPGDHVLIVERTFVSLRKLYTLDGMVFPPEGTSSGTPEELRRIGNLTHTALAPTRDMKPVDLPEIGSHTRRLLYDVITRLEMVTYPVATGALLAFILATAARHRHEPARVDQAFAGLVLCGSLLAFCLATAMFDVLGFPILKWSFQGYNSPGYAPLSVVSAFGLVVLISWLQPPPGRMLAGENQPRDPNVGSVMKS